MPFGDYHIRFLTVDFDKALQATGVLEVTSFKITEALPSVRLLLRAILPNVLWLTSSPLLLRMVPLAPTLKSRYRLWETPAAFGFSISITVAPEECV